MDRTDWDAIVVGSGLGGLSTAAYLTTNGLRTLVLEQYEVAGGCSHVFRRQNKFEFDVGVHYIGDCEPGGVIPNVLDGVGLKDKIEFLELDPDGFDTLVFPELTFRVPRGWDRYLARLIETFPHEAVGLRDCVGVLRAIGEQLGTELPTSPEDFQQFAVKAPTVIEWGLRTLSELFDDCQLSRLPRAVISGESGGHGAPPSRAAVAVHAGLLHHYVDGGAFYPRGGGQVMAAHLIDVIHSHGGRVRTKARVEEILVAQGRVSGVRLSDGEELRSSVVVSAGDYKRTFLELLRPQHVSSETRERVIEAKMALPLFCVYLGLEIDLADRMPNTQYWCHGSSDAEAMYEDCYRGRLPEAAFAYITSASLKDPYTKHIAPPGHSSLELMSIVPPDYAYWGIARGPAAGERYRRKGQYRTMKDELIERLVKTAAEVIPGLEQHIVWKEGATPITQERYTLSSGGGCYGLELSADQVGPNRPSPQTEIDGLFLAGASTAFGHGIAGVLRGGVGTASAVLGRDLYTEAKAGRVFGEPERLTAGGEGWDPLAASRRLSKKTTPRKASVAQPVEA